MASRALGTAKDDLEARDGRIVSRKDPAKGLRFEDLVLGYKFPSGNSIGGPVIGRGSYVAEGLTNLDTETGQGLPALNWTYGAHAVEIEIDTKTGDIDVVRMVSAFDVGRVINDALARAQVVGGGVQGIGTALIEQYVYDGQGRLLNPSFTDYKIPTAKDVPRAMEQIFVETPHDKGPFGARGVAEHPMISVPSAVSNALFDATGLRIHSLPLSPERVCLALRGMGEGGGGSGETAWAGRDGGKTGGGSDRAGGDRRKAGGGGRVGRGDKARRGERGRGGASPGECR
jgi:CO/xanthine dehydrogenase Mo-binding subunit